MKHQNTIMAGTCYSKPRQVALARPELSNTKFKEFFEKKIRNTIKRYSLLNKDMRICVAVSGGKDSTACLYMLKKLGYKIEGVTVDAKIGCYTEENLKNITDLCKKEKIKLHTISFRDEFGMSLCYMKELLESKGYPYSSCFLCGTLRRYLLNKYSKKLRFDVLVTGHNLDDEAQSFIMNVFRNDIILARRQGPVSGITKSEKFTARVKPLYSITESEVIRYTKIMGFPVNYGICPCSSDAYRREYVTMLDDFEKRHPSIKYNILRFHETMAAQLKVQKSVEVNSCEKCGEPASKNMCRACQITSQLSEDKA